MKIYVKLILGYLMVASLIGVVGWFSLNASQQIAESYDRLKEYEEKVDAAAEASSYAKRVEGHLFLYLMLKNGVDKEKFFERYESLEEQIAILEKEVVLPEVSEQVNVLKLFSADALKYGNQLMQLHDINPEAFDYKDHAGLITNFHGSTSGARKAGVTIVNLETSALNQDIEQSIKNATALQQGMITIIILGLVFALCIGIIISSSISKPIGLLRDIAIEIGQGKLGTQIKIQSRDEVGDLAAAFSQMSSKLMQYSHGLEELVEKRTRQLKDAQKRLLRSERLAAVGEVATMVGHDLRNPLQVIENAAYYLNSELSRLPLSTPVIQKTMEMLQAINNSIDYADNILRDLKDFSRTHKPSIKKCDINAIVTEILSKVEAPENVELIVELSNLPEMKTDKDMMRRVFVNLAINGIQAMENGGRLTVTTKETKGFVEVSFEDTGVGMSKETMTKLFTPFFTTKAKGLGLGLAICKRFVENHGGSIEVESEEGKGSTFTVKLPIHERIEVKTSGEKQT